MTKIDPTPLIAEAQARETALKVALDRVEELERAFVIGLLAMFAIGMFLGVWTATARVWIATVFQ